MKRLRIGIIDIVSRGPTRALYARIMNASLASIMPQVIGVWCQEEGHEVTFVCYTGFEDVLTELPDNVDVVFIGAFTEAAHTAYALSNLFRGRGAITVIGGPHARCYPEDAARYFDYVLGFTDKGTLRDVLQDCSQHRPVGVQLAAAQQPKVLPGVRERWQFIDPTLRKAPLLKMVPMLSSLGCPYTCAFCIDATVPYQPMDFEVLREDLRFLLTKFKRPLVAWHDPNFGVRFDDYLDMIEDAVPPGSIDFVAESSLSLLSEPHLKRARCSAAAVEAEIHTHNARQHEWSAPAQLSSHPAQSLPTPGSENSNSAVQSFANTTGSRSHASPRQSMDIRRSDTHSR